jgi:hypothetical protein
MSWSNIWQNVLRTFTRDDSASSSGTVREELMYHFRELVNEEVARGATFDAAWEHAEKQFGSLRHYENECHAMQLQRTFVWGLAVSAAALLFLVCAGWSRFEIGRQRLTDDLRSLKDELGALRREQDSLVTKTAQSVSEQIQPVESDFVGLVLDDEQQPLRDTTVLVTLKTWPYGQYHSKDFAATTDSEGRFLLSKLVPASGQYAIELAVVKDGFAFHSYFHLKQTPEEKLEPITLRLEPASHVTLVVRDDNDVPIRDVKVVPRARESQNGDIHRIDLLGSELVGRMTDAEGRVQFGCFLTGDTVEISVQLPGGDWDLHSFEVSQDDFVIDLASTAVAVN